MHNRTRHKLNFLQAYKTRRFKHWVALQPGNIIGVRVEKKNRQGKNLNRYSILFHVLKKTPATELSKKELIPPFFLIKFPDGKKKKILTDVLEIGAFEFQSGILDPIRNNTARETGTLGVVVGDTNDAYGITNFHVAGFGLMEQDQFFYPEAGGLLPDNLSINGQPVHLYSGVFSNKMDVALVGLGNVSPDCNDLPGGNMISKPYIPFDIDSSWKGQSVFIYSPGHPNGRRITLIDNSVDFDPFYKGILLNDMIGIERCTDPGDSGSIVLTERFELLGIVIGATPTLTYLVPFSRIYGFKRLSII